MRMAVTRRNPSTQPEPEFPAKNRRNPRTQAEPETLRRTGGTPARNGDRRIGNDPAEPAHLTRAADQAENHASCWSTAWS